MLSESSDAFHLWNEVLVLHGNLVQRHSHFDWSLVRLNLLEGAISAAWGWFLFKRSEFFQGSFFLGLLLSKSCLKILDFYIGIPLMFLEFNQLQSILPDTFSLSQQPFNGWYSWGFVTQLKPQKVVELVGSLEFSRELLDASLKDISSLVGGIWAVRMLGLVGVSC